MVSANDYLKVLIELAYHSKNSWRIITEPVLLNDYDKKQFETTLLYLNDPTVYQDYKNGKYDEFIKANNDIRFDLIIANLAPALIEDIETCTQGKYNNILKRTSLSIIPLNKFSAFTTSKTRWNEKLDGCIICINQGLYFCISLMTKAFLFENLEGNLSTYQRTGISDYHRAINLYFAPNKKDLEAYFLDSTLFPPEVYGELSALYSSISTMILQFVALHEFGHIVHKDVYSRDLNRIHFADITENIEVDISSIKATKKLWDAEYEADSFAMRAISSRSKTPQAAWANFITIYLFFKWINDLEIIQKQELCPLHPPPLDRIKNLINVMHEEYGITQEAQEMMDRIDRWSKKWIQDF